MFQFESKLPDTGPTIFSTMSETARRYNAINLGQGFPNFDSPDELKNLINKYLQAGKNQYAPMPGVAELRQAISQKIDLCYGFRPDPDQEITITAGATQAIFTIIAAFIRKDDEVILFEPAYDAYKPAIKIIGGVPRPYTLKAPDFKIHWSEVEKMITPNTKMIIINSPHNPTGMTLTQSDLEALEKMVNKHGLLVLSDEVYEHIIYDDRRHESVLRYPGLYRHAMAVFSFGKTFHATGWKVGYCIAPPYLTQELRKIHQWNVFCVNSFIQYALAEYLGHPAHYTGLANFYQDKRDFFSRRMKDSPLLPLESHGTYFQIYDYSPVSQEDSIAFTMRLIKEYGVASIPASAFYTNGDNNTLIRFCFAKTEDVLEEAAHNLCRIKH